MNPCPECDYIMFAGLCTSCGWHPPGHTLLHENFAHDPECRWCNSLTPSPV